MAKKKTQKKGEDDVEVQQVTVTPKEMNSFYAWEDETLILNVLGTPSAKRDAIGKVKGTQLCISVREAPRAGKATDYMVRFLAGEFGVSTKDIQVVYGRFNVNKQMRIKNPQHLPSSIIREAIPLTDEKTFQKHKKSRH
jgi:uncharacterized protein (TIGR00251 family)